MTRPSALERTELARKIIRLIEATGPISIADYFALCLSDPQFGYYTTREPFGAEGDFVTAPEVSQLFGEMIAIFLIHYWQVQGPAEPIRLIEIGPGRGTLMRDMLRVVHRLAPELFTAATVHMVETSPKLAEVQRQTLQAAGKAIGWHARLDDVPPGRTLLVANELFDALPVRQFVSENGIFREKMVVLDEHGGLAFALGPLAIDPALLPNDAGGQPDGTVFEAAPARQAVMHMIAERLVADDGVALIIDYGHIVSSYGDTLQALRKQHFDPPLAHPGEADLTSHVDFEALARTARGAGAHIAGLAHQGEFLVGLGLLERAGRLGSGKSALEQTAIRTAVERIAGEGAGRMGELFKVLAVTGKPVALAPFRPEGRSANAGD